MKQVITLFILLALQVNLWAQKLQIPKHLEVLFNKSGRETVNHVMQNKQGSYVLVGSDANWFLANDENLFFATVNPNALTSYSKAVPIGKRGAQSANRVVQTRDGGYVIAGFTDSTNKQNLHEAWIIKITELGYPLWNTVVRSNRAPTTHAEFTDIKEAPNGDLWLTGQSENNLWIVNVDAQGQNPIIKLLDMPTNAKEVRGNAMTWAADGKHLLIVGVQEMKTPIITNQDIGKKEIQAPKNQKGLFFTRFNTERGIFYDEHVYPNAEGNAIVRDRTGHLAIVGTHYVNVDHNIFFMYADEKGDTLWTKEFGNKYLDAVGNGVAEDWDGTFYIAGESHKRIGGNRIEGWLHKVRNDGTIVWQEPLLMGGNGTWGADGDDAFKTIITSERGDIVAAGKHYKGARTNGWLVTIPPSVSVPNKSIFNLNIEGGRFHDDEDNAILRPNKRGFYEFWIENRDTVDIFGLVAHINQSQPSQKVQKVNYYKSILIGTLRAKEKRYITIPIEGLDGLKNGEWDFDVHFRAFKQELDLTHSFHLITREELRYKTAFSHSFPETFKEGDTLKYTVTIANSGDLTAQSVKFRTTKQSRTRLLTPELVDLGEIKPNENKVIEAALIVEKDFDASTLFLPVFVVVNGVSLGHQYDLVAHKQLPIPVVDQVSKQLPTRIFWQTSREIRLHGRDSVLNVFSYKATLQAIIELNRAINQQADIHVFVNRNDITQNVKMDNVDFKRLDNEGVKSVYPFRYAIFADVSLKDSVTLVQIEFKDNKEQIQTPKLILKQTAQPKLHLLIVGVSYRDNNGKESSKKVSPLRYTNADAKSIHNAFLSLKGTFFKDVLVTPLLSPIETTAEIIKKEIAKIAKNKDTNDIILVYLSGHGGKTGDGSIIFLGNEYNPTEPNSYLNYQKDIEEPLRKADGQKLVFIDACQSPIKGIRSSDDMADPKGVSEAWSKLVTAAPAYRALLSCTAGESSYECETIGHGAFTQALLDAFQNKLVECQGFGKEKCTANTKGQNEQADHILTFSELVEFVKKRVPYLSKLCPDKEEQHPTERIDPQDESKDIPIFWFDN